MAWTYDEEEQLYTVAFEELDDLLKSLPENTKETPYWLNITGLTNDVMLGAYTAIEGTLQYILLQNKTKYIALNEKTGSVTATSEHSTFRKCSNLIAIKGDFKTLINTSNMFEDCSSLKSVDLSGFCNITGAVSMFLNCSSLISIDVSALTKITSIMGMFNGCRNLTTVENATFSEATDATAMFQGCTSLTFVDTSVFKNVTDASNMFFYCRKLKSIDFSAFSNATKVKNMFEGCDSISTSIVTENPNQAKVQIERLYSLDSGLSISPEDFTYNFKEGLNTVPFEDLEGSLQIVPENTTDTPYELNVTGLTATVMTGDYTAKAGTIQYALQQNPTKYVALNELEGSVTSDSVYYAFFNCYNLISIKGDFTSVTDASSLFACCISLTTIDTSAFTNVTNAEYMFYECTSLTTIDTSAFKNVTNAERMFSGCSSLVTIDTTGFSNVTNAEYMFAECTSLTTIDTSAFSNIINVEWMFYNCTSLTTIDTSAFSNITNTSNMFGKCKSLKTIDTSVFKNVTVASDMFAECTSLVTIDTTAFTNVTEAIGMFYECSSLKTIDTSAFKNVTNASFLFYNCNSLTTIVSENPGQAKIQASRLYSLSSTAFPKDPTEYNYSFKEGLNTVPFEDLDACLKAVPENTTDTPYELNVTGLTTDVMVNAITSKTIGYVLRQNSTKYIALNELEGSVTSDSGYYTFSSCRNIISVKGDFTSVTNASYMFDGCSVTTIDTAAFNNLTYAGSMFSRCSSLTTIDATAFNNVTNTEYMFNDCTSLTTIDTSTFTKVTNARFMFYNCRSLTTIDTSAFTNVTNAGFMFESCFSLKTIDTSAFSNVTDARSMFARCPLKTIDTTAFSNVTKASGMFYGCELITIDTSAFSNVTEARSMFYRCRSLKTIDTSGFSNVTDAEYMFYECELLASIDTSDFTNVTNAHEMFYGCTSLTSIYTSGLSNVTSASGMFDKCSSLISADISTLYNVTYTTGIFNNCTKLKEVNLGIVIPQSTDSSFFSGCTSLNKLITMKPQALRTALSSMTLPVPLSNITISHYAEVDFPDLQTLLSKSEACDKTDPAVLVINDIPLWQDPAVEGTLPYILNQYEVCADLSLNTIETDQLAGLFRNCYKLVKSPKITGTATSGANAFDRCTNLVEIADTRELQLENIDYMYNECSSLKEADLSYFPDAKSAKFVFALNSSLTRLYNLDKMRIGNLDQAFAYNPKLETVEGDFANCEDEVNLFGTFWNGKTLKNIHLTIPSECTNINFLFYECSLINNNCFDLSKFKGNQMYNAFYNCKNLTELPDIPETVKNISACFVGTGLTSITIPDTVEDISLTFQSCTSLKTVRNLHSKLKNATTAFYNCTSLENVYDFNLDLNECNSYNMFSSCTSLKNIYYTPETPKESKWRFIRVKRVALEKYSQVDIYSSSGALERTLKWSDGASDNTIPNNIESIKLFNRLDELILTQPSKLTDEAVEQLFKFRSQFGDLSTGNYLDATKKNFVMKVSEDTNVIQNVVSMDTTLVLTDKDFEDIFGVQDWEKEENKYNVYDSLYPIGSLYWTEDKNLNPNDKFYGTWVRIKDKFIWAGGDNATLGATGGSKKISVDNLPSHDHDFTTGIQSANEKFSWTGSHNHAQNIGGEDNDNWGESVRGQGVEISAKGTGSYSSYDATGYESHGSKHWGKGWRVKTDNTSITVSGTATGNHTHSGTTKKTGSGTDYMPPYETAYCWKRIA